MNIFVRGAMRKTDKVDNYFNVSDEDCALYLREALMNLNDNYPNRDKANGAYGRLILGKLNIKPQNVIIVLPKNKNGYTKIERVAKGNE